MTITSKNLSEISTLGEIMEDCYKKVACPSCGVMKRSNNLTRHLKDPKGHAMTHEQALELRNSLKHGQSHEPDMVKKRRIEALPTKSAKDIEHNRICWKEPWNFQRASRASYLRTLDSTNISWYCSSRGNDFRGIDDFITLENQITDQRGRF